MYVKCAFAISIIKIYNLVLTHSVKCGIKMYYNLEKKYTIFIVLNNI